jgi:hypothetical protein
VGVILIAVVLLDVFLTVLYTRIGTGIISHRLACLLWRLFRAAADPFPRWQNKLLAFCGPIILVCLLAVWAFGLMCGGALISMPKLGTSVASSNGPTPTGFTTALYVAGDSLTTVGTSDLSPRTPAFRLFYAFMSLIGICVFTLTVTYLLEIYNSLQRRNIFALKLHVATAETGDAAELLAGLGANGRFDVGYTHLAEMSAEMVEFKEAHHFYSALFYFRFAEPHYAVSRLALVTLDSISLVKSALDDEEFAWLKESAAVAQLWRASMHLLTLLSESFLPQGLPDPNDHPPDEYTLDHWRRRHQAALHRFRQAGIRTIADERIGVENYIALRSRWDRFITALAEHMAHDMETIDPAGANPARAEQREEFTARLRSAG